MEPKSFTLTIQENPMHHTRQASSPETHIELVPIRDDNNNKNNQDQSPTTTTTNNQSSPITQIIHTLKGGFLFLLLSILIGFIFIAAQIVASWFKSNNTIVLQWTWWWKVDVVELLLFLAILSANVHFMLNASGIVQKQRHALSSVIGVWIVVLLTINMVPNSYEQIKNSTTTTKPNRDGCHSIQLRNREIELQGQGTCFVGPGDAYVKYHFENMTGSELDQQMKFAAHGANLMKGFSKTGLLLKTVKSRTNQFDRNFFGLSSPQCFPKLIDLLCSDLVRKCRYIDCALPSTSCFQRQQFANVYKVIKCVKEYCESSDQNQECSKVDAASISKELIEMIFFLGDESSVFESILDPPTVELIGKLLDILIKQFEQVSIATDTSKIMEPQQECGDWDIDLKDTASLIGNESTVTNLTCDPAKQKFIQAITFNDKNSVILLICILFIFSTIVMMFGNSFQHLHWQLTAVRIVSFLAGMLMAVLIYMGAYHLHQDLIKNSSIQDNKEAQKIWRILYLLVSYACVHGSLLLLAPSIEAEKVEKVASSTGNDVGDTEDENNAAKKNTWIDAIACFKEQFWDASGDFFWLKLVMMEMLEIILQVSSLATGAASSHANEVLLSALLIAANFIVLPLAIIIIPKIFSSSPNVVISTVMVIEVLFDKLYVGIGVLLRYNTLVNRNISFFGQLSVHGGLLIPALMTALDIQDALNLSDHRSSQTTSTQIVQTRPKHLLHRVTEHSIFQTVKKIGFGISIIFGLAFGIYFSYIVEITNQNCEQRIGKISACAEEKYYFSNGLFAETTCAFERVKTFKCTGDQAIDFNVQVLKDAKNEYANMMELTLINVSNSSLISAPLGWASTPQKISIDVSNSVDFSLPYRLCSIKSNVTFIKLDGTFSATELDWTGQMNETIAEFDVAISLRTAGTCSTSLQCGECVGDCNSDSDCKGDLKCYQRNNDAPQSIPGCYGGLLSGNINTWDYCYNQSKAISEVDCLQVAVEVFGPKVTAERDLLFSGSWNHMPQGCSVHSRGDWSAYWNTNQNGINDGYYTIVEKPDKRLFINQVCIEELQTIKTLRLASNGLTDKDLTIENLGGIITTFNQLISLDLRDNKIRYIKSEPGEKVFSPILKRYVDTHNEDGSKNGVNKPPIYLAGNSLQEFKVSTAPANHVPSWTSVLSNVTTVRSIVFKVTEFDSEIKKLVPFFQRWNLRILILHSCFISDQTGVAIGQVLFSSSLKNLDLGYNAYNTGTGIRDAAVLSIVAGISGRITDWYYNQPKGERRIYDQELALNSNNIGSEGCTALYKLDPYVRSRSWLRDNTFECDLSVAIARGNEGKSSTETLGSRLDFFPKEPGIFSCFEASGAASVCHSDWENKAHKFAAVLPTLLDVKVLIIHELRFTYEQVNTIADAIKVSNINRLSLFYNRIEDKGATFLADILPASKLTTLDLRCNQITDIGAASIGKILNRSKLTTLLLGNRNGNTYQSHRYFTAHTVCSVPDKEDFDYRNQIGKNGMVAISQGLPGSKLNHLGIECNSSWDIGRDQEQGVIAIANVLPLSNLTQLEFNNCIGDSSGEAIGKILNRSKLQKLDLRSNRINTSAITIFNGLVNSEMQRLTISYNDFGDQAVMVLIEILPYTNVTYLDVTHNFNVADASKDKLREVCVANGIDCEV